MKLFSPICVDTDSNSICSCSCRVGSTSSHAGQPTTNTWTVTIILVTLCQQRTCYSRRSLKSAVASSWGCCCLPAHKQHQETSASLTSVRMSLASPPEVERNPHWGEPCGISTNPSTWECRWESSTMTINWKNRMNRDYFWIIKQQVHVLSTATTVLVGHSGGITVLCWLPLMPIRHPCTQWRRLVPKPFHLKKLY